MTHLWESDHPYYCSEAAWSANYHNWHASADEFLSTFGDSDQDLNYVVRWDWQTDEESGTQTFYVYEVRQRKGFLSSHEFPVTHDDEPKLREWLMRRYQTVLANWFPIAEVPANV